MDSLSRAMNSCGRMHGKSSKKINVFEFSHKLIPSLNAAHGKKWTWWNKIRDEIYEAVEEQLAGKHRMTRCAIEWIEYSDQPSDFGNLAFGLKYPLDAIKDQYCDGVVNCENHRVLEEERLIPDDSPEFVVDCKLTRIKVAHKKDRKHVLIMRGF